MKIIKKNYICPFCFSHSDLYQVEFRCTNNDPKKCPPEPDRILSDFRGFSSPKIMSRVVTVKPPTTNIDKLKSLMMPREATCDECHEITRQRICPKCHCDLPYTIGDYKDLIFAVIGAKEAGKSHYIAVLIDVIKKQIGANFGTNLHPLNDETINRYREDFYNPVFRRKEIIAATRSAIADFSVRIPLIYTLSFMGDQSPIMKMFSKKKKISDIATIVFFDTAGEDMDQEDTMSTVNKYIFNSSGIILLIDPLQLPDVRSRLSGVPLPSENTEAKDILDRIVNLIKKARSLRANELIDIPISLVFTKIDAVDSLIDDGSSLKHTGQYDGVFDKDDFDAVNSEMESLIKDWAGSDLIDSVEHNFSNYAFFGLTALGCNPHATRKIDRFRPHRVEDPFLWLLWKHKLIK